MQPEPRTPSPSQEASLARLLRLSAEAGLLEVVPGTSYGTPALRIKDKFFVRLLDANTLVLPCPLEQKEMLIETANDRYFETDHYKGWPSLLVRLERIDDAELRSRLKEAWQLKAPRRLLKQSGP